MKVVPALRRLLEETTAALLQEYGREGQLRVAGVTKYLTETIAGWAYEQETKWRDRRWNVYRELSLPLAPGASARYGRVDLTLMRPDAPDVVIEVDSANKPQSLEKLLFARDAGAVAVWVRWHEGRVAQSQAGVSVVDLVGGTRGLAG